VSSGSACTSASLEPSYVLRALGVEEDMAHTSIRWGDVQRASCVLVCSMRWRALLHSCMRMCSASADAHIFCHSKVSCTVCAQMRCMHKPRPP
jgi:hypothetical protein